MVAGVDKYEFKLKVDEMKALVSARNYHAAAEIAETVNWRKIRNLNALVLAGEVFEQVERYEESKEILLMAYDKSPIGRNIIYRLAEIAIKTGNFEEAQEYYDEFVDIAPHDNLKFVLKYKMTAAQGLPYKEQIKILEELKEQEYSEEWAYELAYLYHRDGQPEKCVEACDELILWFGDGIYVEKALELKMHYQPLTKTQEEKYRLFRQKRTGVIEVKPNDFLESGEIVNEAVKIPSVETSTGQYNTVNLQEEIAKGMQQIAAATGKEELSDAMDSIKRLVDEIPYLSEHTQKIQKQEKRREDNLKASQPELVNALSIEEIQAEWEKTKQEMQNSLRSSEVHHPTYTEGFEKEEDLDDDDIHDDMIQNQVPEEERMLEEGISRSLEAAKAKSLKAAENLMERLLSIVPQLADNIPQQELSGQEYTANRQPEQVQIELEEASRIVAGMNQLLQEQIDSLTIEDQQKKAPMVHRVSDPTREIPKLPEEILAAEENMGVDDRKDINMENMQNQVMGVNSVSEEVSAIDRLQRAQMNNQLMGQAQLNQGGISAIDLLQRAKAGNLSADSVQSVQKAQEPVMESVQMVQRQQEPVMESVQRSQEPVKVPQQNSAAEMMQRPSQQNVSVESMQIPQQNPAVENVQIPQQNPMTEFMQRMPIQSSDIQNVQMQQQNPAVENIQMPQQNMAEESMQIPQQNLPAENVQMQQQNSPVESMQIPQQNPAAENVQMPQQNMAAESMQVPQQNLPTENVQMPQQNMPVENIHNAYQNAVESMSEMVQQASGMAEEFVQGAVQQNMSKETGFVRGMPQQNSDMELKAQQAEGTSMKNIEERIPEERIPLEQEVEEDQENVSLPIKPKFRTHAQIQAEATGKRPRKMQETEEISEEDMIAAAQAAGFYETPQTDIMEDDEDKKLTPEQKQIFSYFVPITGMEVQIYDLLKGVSEHLLSDKNALTGNIVIEGISGSGKTVLIMDIIKVLQKEVKRPNGKIGKIDANALNQKDLDVLTEKVSGGCLIIESAGKISRETAVKLSRCMEKDHTGTLYILEDTKQGIQKALDRDSTFAAKFTEKISIPLFTNDELVAFGRAYANDLEYDIDEMGILALYKRISNLQKHDHIITLTEVKEIVDEAIDNAEKGVLKKVFGILTSTRANEENYIILREKDFEE